MKRISMQFIGMAIRMKEWGMLEYPGRAPQFSVHGIDDWGNSMNRMGQAVAGFLENTGHFVEDRMQVTSTGNLADFAGKLKEIEQSTRDEIMTLPIRDWDYAWEQSSAPLLESAINELPEEVREVGKDMAMLYNRRASLQARRDYELECIGQARSQWEDRVQSSVNEGDDEAAGQWLEAGRRVFVPEEEMEAQQQSVRSKCSLQRWQRRLHEKPLDTLQLMQQNQPEDWPCEQNDVTRLQEQADETKRRLTIQLAQELVARVEQGNTPTADDLQQVAAAGLLATPDPLVTMRPLKTQEVCDWLRRIDERDADDLQDAALKIEIATAPIPLNERQMLLNRLSLSANVAAEIRRDYSRRLWNAYRAGSFGCCGDDAALRRLGELQEKGLHDLMQQGKAAELSLSDATDWNHWVCFESE